MGAVVAVGDDDGTGGVLAGLGDNLESCAPVGVAQNRKRTAAQERQEDLHIKQNRTRTLNPPLSLAAAHYENNRVLGNTHVAVHFFVLVRA